MFKSACILIILTLLVLSVVGQSRLGAVPHYGGGEKASAKGPGEFTFVRTIYGSRFGGRRGGSWAVDYPEAAYHFIMGVLDWSGSILNIAAEPKQLEIMNEKLFDFPLIYFVEPGYLELSDEEALRLREYVSRGGFLFLD